MAAKKKAPPAPETIQERLKKVPPFEDDIEMLKEMKKNAPQEEEEKEEEVVEEKPEEEPKEEVPPEEEKKDEKEEKRKKRTKEQVEKLTQHNKQLKGENEVLLKNVVESLKPEAPPPPPPKAVPELSFQQMKQADQASTELPQTKVDDIYDKLIDEQGYIDPDLLIKTLRQANEEAKKAREEAEEAKRRAEESERQSKQSIRDFEEDREVRRVHKKYPQIDPKNDDFNEMFWDDVRKEIATAPILRGEAVTFMQAADKIWKERYAPQEKEVEVKKKDKKKAEETENQKRNINASVSAGHYSEYYAKAEMDDLKQATIQGRRGALAERLRRIGQ